MSHRSHRKTRYNKENKILKFLMKTRVARNVQACVRGGVLLLIEQ
jgi:hypothetical protein